MSKNRHFSMELNLQNERDRLVFEVLEAQPGSKADYVKTAVLAYAASQSIKETIREALAGATLPVPDVPAICSPPKSALNAEAEPPQAESPAPAPNTKKAMKKAMGFMQSLQNES